MPEQWAVPDRYKLPREPTQAVELSDSDSDDQLGLMHAGAAAIAEPTCYRLSQQCSDAQLWQKACEEEMGPHRVNGTWQIVKLPPEKRAIGSGWFMKVKYMSECDI